MDLYTTDVVIDISLVSIILLLLHHHSSSSNYYYHDYDLLWLVVYVNLM